MNRRALSDLPPDTFDDGRDAEREESAGESEAALSAEDAPEIDFDFDPGAVQAGTYNTRPLVPEVLVREAEWALVRPRVEVADLIALDRLPPWL